MFTLRNATERTAMNIKYPGPDTAKIAEDRTRPARVNRKRGAQIITDLYFPISHRTLETWPIAWRYVNGRATCDIGDLLILAEAKLNAAPPLMGGRKAGRHQKEENFSTL